MATTTDLARELPATRAATGPTVGSATVPPAPDAAATPVRQVAQIGRKKPEPRPTPVRSAAYVHLSVAELRDLRTVLSEEESRVSYWRRILQARLDVLAHGMPGRGLDPELLAPVLTDHKVGAGRQAMARFVPVDDEPPLPSLATLWERQVDLTEPAECEALAADLREAEGQLSAYRASLHVRIGEATTDLIARYRDEPSLCLTALPL